MGQKTSTPGPNAVERRTLKRTAFLPYQTPIKTGLAVERHERGSEGEGGRGQCAPYPLQRPINDAVNQNMKRRDKQCSRRSISAAQGPRPAGATAAISSRRRRGRINATATAADSDAAGTFDRHSSNFDCRYIGLKIRVGAVAARRGTIMRSRVGRHVEGVHATGRQAGRQADRQAGR
jgi:hypothetical protein